MVDYFALALSHGLLAFAAWRLLWRGDLDADPAEPEDPLVPPTAPDQPGAPRLTPQVKAVAGLRTRA